MVNQCNCIVGGISLVSGKAKVRHCVLNVGHDIKTAKGLEFVVNGRDVTVQGIAVGCDDNLAAFFFDCFIN